MDDLARARIGRRARPALLIAECNDDTVPPINNWTKDDEIQSQRWAAVGRLAGGVVHDFNNILTGVMLYCDLLLSSIEGRDRRRRYAEEIRSAIMQATGMVQQLLVFARPQASQVRELCLNQIAQALRSLLTRLIGENISLELKLDPASAAQTRWTAPWVLRPVVRLGQRSYEIYLTHVFVVFGLFELFVVIGKPIAAVPALFVGVILVSGLSGEMVAGFYSELLNRWLRRRWGDGANRLGSAVSRSVIHEKNSSTTQPHSALE